MEDKSVNRYHEDEVSCWPILYLEIDNEPVNGVVYGEHEYGQLAYEHNYKDGKKDGLQRLWYENGQLLFEANYKA